MHRRLTAIYLRWHMSYFRARIIKGSIGAEFFSAFTMIVVGLSWLFIPPMDRTNIFVHWITAYAAVGPLFLFLYGAIHSVTLLLDSRPFLIIIRKAACIFAGAIWAGIVASLAYGGAYSIAWSYAIIAMLLWVAIWRHMDQVP